MLYRNARPILSSRCRLRSRFAAFAAFAVIASVLIVGGCSDGFSTISPDFGVAVRSVRVDQTLNPQPRTKAVAVEGLDGQAAVLEVEAYVDSFEGAEAKETAPKLVSGL